MGVAGAGKSTVGRIVADTLECGFLDADDLHSPENVAAMRSARPLTEAERRPWLEALRARVSEIDAAGESIVIACSALTREFRARLATASDRLRYVFLRVEPAVLQARLESRQGHFMGVAMLASQLATLEEPDDAIVIEVLDQSPDELSREIVSAL